MYSNFLLGTLCVTDAAKIKLGRVPLDLIARHAINEHGLAPIRRKRLNDLHMRTAGEIVSIYLVDPTDPAQGRVVITTDAEWATTEVKLESEP